MNEVVAMDKKPSQQSIEVFSRVKGSVTASGKIFKPDVRSALPGLTNFQFEMLWVNFRQQLRQELGVRLKPIPKSGGMYRVDTVEEGIDSALNKDRLKIVAAVRKHLQALVDVQKRADLSSESRDVLRREEDIRSRDAAATERLYLQRKKALPGFE